MAALHGQSVLGIGFTAPYLRLWREQAARCIALTPAQMGATRWPAGAPNLSCTAEEDALPFPDLMLRPRAAGARAGGGGKRPPAAARDLAGAEGRRAAAGGGAEPQRHVGAWESTPFGHGQPYSFGQIGRLLAAALYRVERRDTALYVPPCDWRLVLRSGRLWENTGRRLLPQLAGVTITEAVKDLYAAMPVKAAPRRRMVLVETT